jgi:hypothetical protein
MRVSASARYTCGMLAASLLAGCAQHSGWALPATSDAQPFRVLPQTGPPPCKGQRTAKEYAYDTETLSTKGGVLCIPVFGGFGGMIPYAPVAPSIKIKLITSTTNYDHKLPELGKGTTLVYDQLVLSRATTFAKKGGKGVPVITGTNIVPGKPYSLFVQFIVKGKKENSQPCYSIATKSKYGGVIQTGAVPLRDQSIASDTTVVAELYPGMQTKTKCS